MCLITEKEKGVKVAETDIEVYKVFERVKGFLTYYKGPYKDYYYGNLNGLYSCEGFDNFTFDNQPDDDWTFVHLWKGVSMSKEYEEKKRMTMKDERFIFVGFHSFKYLKDAFKEIMHLKFCNENEEYDVICCTIPKGTKYYEGLFDGEECYCSEQIKLNY